MRDIYRQRKRDFDRCLASFPPVEKQTGLMAFIGGAPAGFDIVSRADAYSRLHNKLIRSYASGILFRRGEEKATVGTDHCRAFISTIIECAETRHPAVSLGEDFRYSSRTVCGSALLYEDTLIHGAFFSDVEERSGSGRMSGYRARRSYKRHPEN
jgi:hypothetical protein